MNFTRRDRRGGGGGGGGGGGEFIQSSRSERVGPRARGRGLIACVHLHVLSRCCAVCGSERVVCQYISQLLECVECVLLLRMCSLT